MAIKVLDFPVKVCFSVLLHSELNGIFMVLVWHHLPHECDGQPSNGVKKPWKSHENLQGIFRGCDCFFTYEKPMKLAS